MTVEEFTALCEEALGDWYVNVVPQDDYFLVNVHRESTSFSLYFEREGNMERVREHLKVFGQAGGDDLLRKAYAQYTVECRETTVWERARTKNFRLAVDREDSPLATLTWEPYDSFRDNYRALLPEGEATLLGLAVGYHVNLEDDDSVYLDCWENRLDLDFTPGCDPKRRAYWMNRAGITLPDKRREVLELEAKIRELNDQLAELKKQLEG